MFLTRRCVPELLKMFCFFQTGLGERVKVVTCCHGKTLVYYSRWFAILGLTTLRPVLVKSGRGRGQDKVRPLSFPRFVTGIHVLIFLCAGL